MSIDAPDNRPALGWVLDLPRGWVTSNQRLVLLALALDSYDGRTCSPGRSAILTATGLWTSSYWAAVEALQSPTDDRPALLRVSSRRGKRTVFELLNGIEPGRGIPTHPHTESESGNPDSLDTSNTVGESRLPPAPRPGRGIPTHSDAGATHADPEVSRASKSGNPVGEVSRGTTSGNPDYHLSSPPPDHEGGRRREDAHAPAPNGAERERGEEDLAGEVLDTLRQRWNGTTPAMSNRTRTLLADLVDNGWTPAAILAGVATIGDKPRNPVRLLEAHLKRLLTDHQPRDFTASNTDPSPPAEHHASGPTVDDVLGAGPGRCHHGVPIRPGVSWCTDCEEEYLP